MKNTLTSLILVLTIVSCRTKKTMSMKTEFENGWYFITEQKSESKPVEHRFTSEIIYVEINPIVKASESSSLEIKNQTWAGKDNKIIQLIFTGEAKEKWADATERMSESNEFAAFIYNGKVISIGSAITRMENGYSAVADKNFTTELLKPIVADLKRKKITVGNTVYN